VLRRLADYVEQASLGEVFVAPLDVELAPDKVVQPDLLVVLRSGQAIVTESRIIGAPDLIVEVASPSTASYDRREKWNAYAAAGVVEYWIVDPSAQTIEVLVLEQGSYRSRNVFRGQAVLPSQVLPDLPILVDQFFA
jgi:Uma2 family endonuclease